MKYECPENVGVDHMMTNHINLQYQNTQENSAGANIADSVASGQNQLKNILCALLKSSDQFGLVKTTKFLAHQYLLKFLERCPQSHIIDPQILMITSLRLAVKFNQNIQISDGYTIACCVNQCQGRFSEEQFIDFELFMLKILNYKLSIRSPYDYFDEISQNLGLTEHHRQLFQAFLDFTLSLIEFKECSADKLFVYCFNAVFINRKIQNLKLFNYITSLIRKYSNALQKAYFIKESVMRMDDQNQQMENTNQ